MVPRPRRCSGPRRVATSASGVLLGPLCQSFVMARMIARVLAVVFGFSFGYGILRRVATRRRSVKREVVKSSP